MPSDDTHTYLSGTVGATMKKRYPTIGIDKRTGDPLKSHCECPAGKGPHGTCISMLLQFYLWWRALFSSQEMV